MVSPVENALIKFVCICVNSWLKLLLICRKSDWNRKWTQIDANKAFVQVVNKSLSAVLTENTGMNNSENS